MTALLFGAAAATAWGVFSEPLSPAFSQAPDWAIKTVVVGVFLTIAAICIVLQVYLIARLTDAPAENLTEALAQWWSRESWRNVVRGLFTLVIPAGLRRPGHAAPRRAWLSWLRRECPE